MTGQQIDAIREQVLQANSKITGLSRERIDEKSNLSKLGIDSLMALSVVAAIEKQLKMNIPEKRLRSVKNIDDLVNVVISELSVASPQSTKES